MTFIEVIGILGVAWVAISLLFLRETVKSVIPDIKFIIANIKRKK